MVSQSRLNTVMRIWLRLMRLYFRLDVEGLAHVPKKGGALLIANHSGFAGADALILAHVVKRASKRRPRILAHRAFFDFLPELRNLSERFGLKKASLSEGVEALKRGRLVMIFPEGEKGNFKSSLKRYRLQEFKTGFLRMALLADVPIIPCIVLGAEESHLNLGNINLSRIMKGLRIPLPINLLPLPAKWRILVLPALRPDEQRRIDVNDREALEARAAEIRKSLQKEIRAEVRRRRFVYSPILRSAQRLLGTK